MVTPPSCSLFPTVVSVFGLAVEANVVLAEYAEVVPAVVVFLAVPALSLLSLKRAIV